MDQKLDKLVRQRMDELRIDHENYQHIYGDMKVAWTAARADLLPLLERYKQMVVELNHIYNLPGYAEELRETGLFVDAPSIEPDSIKRSIAAINTAKEAP